MALKGLFLLGIIFFVCTWEIANLIQKGVTWSKSSLHRPFCSIRCKQIDFGEWATEGFKIPDKENNTNLGNSEKEKNEDSQYHDL